MGRNEAAVMFVGAGSPIGSSAVAVAFEDSPSTGFRANTVGIGGVGTGLKIASEIDAIGGGGSSSDFGTEGNAPDVLPAGRGSAAKEPVNGLARVTAAKEPVVEVFSGVAAGNEPVAPFDGRGVAAGNEPVPLVRGSGAGALKGANSDCVCIGIGCALGNEPVPPVRGRGTGAAFGRTRVSSIHDGIPCVR